MRTAIYINDGLTQLVLTPESEWERNIIQGMPVTEKATILRGSFYETQGGWLRESTKADSLIIRFEPCQNSLPTQATPT